MKSGFGLHPAAVSDVGEGSAPAQEGLAFGRPQFFAVFYLTVATVYAALAFKNFSVIEVIGSLLLYSALPTGLILFTASSRNMFRAANRWIAIGFAGCAALIMLFIQFSGLKLWENYFSNFANQRLEVGDPGFHPDSVFHVAVIQGILNNGFPTTGQHLEPWLGYHVLSHYLDAVALLLLAIDPWESYALLFFSKGVAITLAVVYFVMKVAKPYSAKMFWLSLLIVYPAFTSSWHVIGSHGQWFPMMLLALSAYHVFVVAMKERRTGLDYALLTLLVVALSLGKVSLGFSFAVLVGFWLFLRKPVDWRLVVTGASWVTFFVLYAVIFLGSRSGDIERPAILLGNLGISGAEIFGICLIGILSGVVVRGAQQKYGASFTTALGVSLGVVALAVVVATDNSSDGFYFFSGLFSVALFLSVPLVAGILLGQPKGAIANHGSEKTGLRLLAFVGSLLFVSSPVVATGQVSPYSNLSAIWSTASAMRDHSYVWFNEAAGRSESMSVWRALRGIQLPDKETPYATQLRVSLREFVAENELSDQSPLLHLTSEQFVVIAEKFSAPNSWSAGLAVTAVTGLPLVFGVAGPDFRYYGFSDYDQSALVKTEDETSLEVLCGFNRPVIIAVEVDALEFMLACPATS